MDNSVDWRKSQWCDNGACVEVAREDGAVLVRQAGNDDSPILRFTLDEWTAFVAGVRSGDFDFG